MLSSHFFKARVLSYFQSSHTVKVSLKSVKTSLVSIVCGLQCSSTRYDNDSRWRFEYFRNTETFASYADQSNAGYYCVFQTHIHLYYLIQLESMGEIISYSHRHKLLYSRRLQLSVFGLVPCYYQQPHLERSS